MEIDEVIKGKLTELGIEMDSLKAFILNYLRQIEHIISEKEKRQKAACEDLVAAEYTVSSIAEEVGMSRTTFYSYNRILQRYVELSASLSEKNNPIRQVELLKAEVRDLDSKVGLMADRDIKAELKAFEIKMLRKMVADKNAEIESLRARLSQKTQR